MCRDRALFSFLRGKKKKNNRRGMYKYLIISRSESTLGKLTALLQIVLHQSLLYRTLPYWVVIYVPASKAKKKKNEAICLSSGYKNETLCVIIVVSVCIIFKWLSMLPLIAFQLLTEWKKTQHTFWRPSKQHWTQIPTHNFMDSSLTLLPKIKTSEVKTWMGKHLWQKCLTKDTILVQ